MIVRDSGRKDPQYGELYYVNGVIGDFAGINFLYLKKIVTDGKLIVLEQGLNTTIFSGNTLVATFFELIFKSNISNFTSTKQAISQDDTWSRQSLIAYVNNLG